MKTHFKIRLSVEDFSQASRIISRIFKPENDIGSEVYFPLLEFDGDRVRRVPDSEEFDALRCREIKCFELFALYGIDDVFKCLFSLGEPSDKWEHVDGALCCSFCLSLHPFLFLNYIFDVISRPEVRVRIEINDKHDKIYVYGIREGENFVKHYLMHTKDYCAKNFVDVREMDRILLEAIQVSKKKFEVFCCGYMRNVTGVTDGVAVMSGMQKISNN